MGTTTALTATTTRQGVIEKYNDIVEWTAKNTLHCVKRLSIHDGNSLLAKIGKVFVALVASFFLLPAAIVVAVASYTWTKICPRPSIAPPPQQVVQAARGALSVLPTTAVAQAALPVVPAAVQVPVAPLELNENLDLGGPFQLPEAVELPEGAPAIVVPAPVAPAVEQVVAGPVPPAPVHQPAPVERVADNNEEMGLAALFVAPEAAVPAAQPAAAPEPANRPVSPAEGAPAPASPKVGPVDRVEEIQRILIALPRKALDRRSSGDDSSVPPGNEPSVTLRSAASDTDSETEPLTKEQLETALAKPGAGRESGTGSSVDSVTHIENQKFKVRQTGNQLKRNIRRLEAAQYQVVTGGSSAAREERKRIMPPPSVARSDSDSSMPDLIESKQTRGAAASRGGSRGRGRGRGRRAH